MTAIYRRLHPAERSRWGVVRSGELWPWHSGGPLTGALLTLPQIHEMVDRLFEAEQLRLGELAGQPAGAWVAGGEAPAPEARPREQNAEGDMATDTDAGRMRDLPLRNYRPRSRLVVPEHHVPSAAVPAIDSHAHLGRWLSPDGSWMVKDVPRLVAEMDQCNIRGIVNLDGRWGEELGDNLARYDHAYPGRFATCCHLDWRELSAPGFGERLAAGLRRCADAGAAGVKVWKDLGLHLRDDHGELVLPGDQRLAPAWAAAGELRLPIFIHTADPVAFFDPVDARNERLEQLLSQPDWSFSDPRFPSFERLIDSLEELVAAHPHTTFVGVHVGCYAENLAWVGRMLDTYPNFYVDTAARIAELGRQPRATSELISRHPGRVLFGTDEIPFDTRVYGIYFRFLQTLDESFDHDLEDPPPMGRWKISGLGLAGDVLRQVYAANAEALVPRLRGAR